MKNYNLNKKNLEIYSSLINENIIAIKNNDYSYLSDPDKKIEQKYIVEGEQITFSTDGICGVKYFNKYYAGENKSEDYSLIRNKIIMWPKHKQSINQRRYACFRDRIDFTIFDIKIFYETLNNKEESKSRLILKNTLTYKYFKYLKSFKNFIDEYELEIFVDDNENVINLSTEKLINGYEDYCFNKETNTKYLKNLIKKLGEE